MAEKALNEKPPITMLFAQITNGIVMNIIALDDPSLEPIFAQGFDFLIQVDRLDLVPGVGWKYVDGIFIEVVIIDKDNIGPTGPTGATGPIGPTGPTGIL